MSVYILSDVEEKLIKRYQQTKDQDIALYFFNKLGDDILSIIYSKVNCRFSSIPIEREDLTSIVWRSLTETLKSYKKDRKSLWNNWINGSYCNTVNEIQKYFTNSELILNHAGSWDEFQDKHFVVNSSDVVDEEPKNYKQILEPIVEYVKQNNKTYGKRDIKKLLYLKSFGYSEREIAKKMNVSRRYISSMIKVVLKIASRYLRTSDRKY